MAVFVVLESPAGTVVQTAVSFPEVGVAVNSTAVASTSDNILKTPLSKGI